ncbi:hypothetical protein B0H13DRAFT_1853742 [Mycena leptocephala]|nr:hypothetical protein B0H13DRAFT_1853742 [Mycena leptocephala]
MSDTFMYYFLEYQQQRESRHAGEIHGREKTKVRNWGRKKRWIIANSREEMKRKETVSGIMSTSYVDADSSLTAVPRVLVSGGLSTFTRRARLGADPVLAVSASRSSKSSSSERLFTSRGLGSTVPESGFLVFWLRIATRSLGVCHGDDSVPAKFLVHEAQIALRDAEPPPRSSSHSGPPVISAANIPNGHSYPQSRTSAQNAAHEEELENSALLASPALGQFEQARLGTNRTVPSSETDVVESASCDVVNQSPARASDTGPTEPDTESPQPSDVEQRRQRSASSIQRRLSSLRMLLPQVVGPDRTILPVPRDCGLRSESKFHREKELPSTQIEDDSSLVLGRHASNADSLARLNFHGRKDQQGQPENQTQHGQQMQMQTHLTVLPLLFSVVFSAQKRCPRAHPSKYSRKVLPHSRIVSKKRKDGLVAHLNRREKISAVDWLRTVNHKASLDNDANRVEEDSWLETASDYERGFAHLDTKEMGLKKLKRFAVEVVKIYANTTSKKRKRVHQGSWVITAMTVHSSSDERLLAGPAPGHFLEGYDVGSRSCTAISETAE